MKRFMVYLKNNYDMGIETLNNYLFLSMIY